MHIRKLTTTLALVGACTLGSLAAVSPVQAAVAPASRSAAAQNPAAGVRWIHNSSYFTYTACAAEGQYIVDNFPHYIGWKCLFASNEDLWELWILYDPL